jgi:hypothetical protein
MVTTSAIGAVQYEIVGPNSIQATYTSSFLLDQGFTQILTGEATGDTSGGFPGRYRVRYMGPGNAINGDFDWEIVEVGEALRLYWRMRKDGLPHIPGKEGMVVLEGMGLRTSDTTIVVAYWVTPAFDRARLEASSKAAARP